MAPNELYTYMCSSTGQTLRLEVDEHGLDKLLLKYAKIKGFPYSDVLVQWQLQNKAFAKFPELIRSNPHWLFSDAQIIEQATAEMISNQRLVDTSFSNIADLTGGLGIDLYAMLPHSKEALYVDVNDKRVQYAQWNFKNFDHISFVHGRAEEAWKGQTFDLVFIDPDRRANGKRTFKPEDSSPNLTLLLPDLVGYARNIWIKLSPMVDIMAIQQTYPYAHVEVWSMADEVKEVTVCIGDAAAGCSAVMLSKDGARRDWAFTQSGDAALANNVEEYIYYPDAAIRKMQAWGALTHQYGLKMLDSNTHVFTHDKVVVAFPGKIWRVKNVSKPGDKSLIKPEGMHVMRKNYPQSVAELRKRYKIKEGRDLLLACKVLGKNTWITAEQL